MPDEEVSLKIKRPKKGHWQTSAQGGWEWVEDQEIKPKTIPNDPRQTAQPGTTYA